MVLESYQTHVSKPIIMADKFGYKLGEKIIVSGWVNYNEEATSDVLLRIILENPSEREIFEEYIVSGIDGTFAIEIPIEKNSEVGDYEIKVISQCREIHREICTHQYGTIPISIMSDTEQKKTISRAHELRIVDWVNGRVNDTLFVVPIKYLTEQNFISTPNFQIPEGDFRLSIPSWIKTTGGYWIDKDISDEEFIKVIEWSINKGIIKFVEP